jgi:hypothetical protein
LRDFARRPRRIAGGDRNKAQLAGDLAALAQSMDVAMDRFQPLQCGAFDGHELEMDRQKEFAYDVQP